MAPSFEDIIERILKEAIDTNKINTEMLTLSLKYQYEYADALRKAKDYKMALEYNFKLLYLLDKIQPTEPISKLFVLNNIGVCYFESGDPNEAIKWYDRCRQEAEECSHWEMVLKCLRNLSWAYLQIGKLYEHEQAFKEHQKITKMFGLNDSGPPGIYGNPIITD